MFSSVAARAIDTAGTPSAILTTRASGERFAMRTAERVLLYAVAIQTGLRSGELRTLTRGRLFLDVDKPFITCKAGATKNGMDARQYITTDLAG